MFADDFLQTVSHSPGVYLMLDRRSKVVYVGKAKDLRKRLASYVRFSGVAHSKTGAMLARVKKVDTLLTRTEKEALILEASLIKKHKPKYNVILRDDKNYPLIKVTLQEQWPRVMMTRRRRKDGARYFGPYSSSSAMWHTLRLIAKLFPLRTCKGSEVKLKKRPCLNFQMNRCLGVCVGLVNQQQYRAMVDQVLMVLEGRNRDLIKDMQKQMHKAAEQLDFESAATLRDQIGALSKTLEKQVVAAGHFRDQDIFGFVRHDVSVALTILFIRSGLISGSRSFFLADPYGDNRAILSQTLNQYYDQGDNLPKEILLPFKAEDQMLLAERFSDLRGSNVRLHVPQRGDGRSLIGMATMNAEQLFEEQEKKEKSWLDLEKLMIHKLRLDRGPQRIECLDISNISGTHAVGALVCFVRGEPLKSCYRHYKIKTVKGPDDYAMMTEVLQRRLSRGLAENDLPDLFLVDGGRGQLSMAMRVASELGIVDELDWLGIAKERSDEGEKLYKPGRKNPIILPPHNPIILYLMRIRDESHRYGVTFHRKLRNAASLTSILDGINGVGPARKKQLLKTLGSLKRVKAASRKQLAEVPGIGPELATEIHSCLHPDSNK
ncbi:MAG: excinuclease ABC subunit UvrC [Thermodesulfobacteriota bacterium]